MKVLNVGAIVLAICLFSACKKEDKTTVIVEQYSSTTDFFEKNRPALQIYTINGSAGGSFTSPQGTVVTIPSNAFVNGSNATVKGEVKIEFMDLYKKSDMLLADMSTTMFGGAPLKSGGEFFIKASFNNEALNIAKGKKIDVEQPAALTGGIDQANPMQAFLLQEDSSAIKKWQRSVDSAQRVFNSTFNYIYTLYEFKNPLSEGTWCNSDNSGYFSKYAQSTFTMTPEKGWSAYELQVFLVFRDIHTMVHVYFDESSFPYRYAPVGLACTVVAIGVRNGIVYSSFTPITISANSNVEIHMSASNSEAFKTALKALN